MPTLNHCKQLDQQILAEVNVKELRYILCTTEKGDLILVFDGHDYVFMLDGQDVTTEKLYSNIHNFIYANS